MLKNFAQIECARDEKVYLFLFSGETGALPFTIRNKVGNILSKNYSENLFYVVKRNCRLNEIPPKVSKKLHSNRILPYFLLLV